MEPAQPGAHIHDIQASGNAIQLINNTGSVTISQEASEQNIPPSTIYDVPELLSPFFTGREDDLQRIQDAFSSGLSKGDVPVRCIIYGIPGQGKTQLALRYARSVFEKGHRSHVFWISGATVEKATEGFAWIASLLHLPRRAGSSQAEKAELARSWLTRPGSPWLLVIDNVNSDTATVINNLLPRSGPNGSILITTRTMETARRLSHIYGHHHSQFELHKLIVNDSAQLLHKLVHGDDTPCGEEQLKAFKEVSRRTGCLPLAIAQAGSFMEMSGQTPEAFLSTFDNAREKDEILKWADGVNNYDGQPVMATIMLALEEIKTASPTAIDLLRILAFLDPEATYIKHITQGSDRLLRYPANPDWREYVAPLDSLKALFDSKTKLFGVLRQLQRLSLAIMRGKNETQVLWLHDLVQSVLRDKLMTESEQRMWLSIAIALVTSSFEAIGRVDIPKVWPDCEVFVSQLDSLNRHAGILDLKDARLLDSNEQLAKYLIYCGRVKQAQVLLVKTMRGKAQLHGPEHPSTLTSTNNLAECYRLQGRLEDAERLLVEVIRVRKSVLGAKHRDTLQSMNNLAVTFADKGQLQDASKLEMEVMNIRKRTFGPEHPDTLVSMNNVATTLQGQGDFDAAEELFLEVFKVRNKTLGPEHPDTLLSIRNVITIYMHQGLWDEAENLQVPLCGIQQRVLSPEHPSTMSGLANLASIRLHQGSFEEAEKLFAQVIEFRENTLGPRHSETLGSKSSLALLLWQSGRLEEARDLEADILASSKISLGAEHPQTLFAMDNLAHTLKNLGENEDAMRMMTEAAKLRTKVLGQDHRDTQNSRETLRDWHNEKEM